MRYKKPLRLLFTGLVILFFNISYTQVWNPGHLIGTISGDYSFSYTQTPSQLVELQPAGVVNTGLTYQWEYSYTPNTVDFKPISGAVSSTLFFNGPLNQTTYYRRKTSSSPTNFIYSNIVKLQLVSSGWEDINYVREYDVLTTGITTWQAVDQLPIGQKLQTTTYLDGLGRSLEKVSKETATPAPGNTLWGDMVQFSQYDAAGREPLKYLPYTTTSQSGKFKTDPATEQTQYYANTYNETSAFSSIDFDNSPLNRLVNVKEPGFSWAGSAGTKVIYDANTLEDNVQMYSIDYVQGNAPINNGPYPTHTLYKLVTIDVNGKQVIEYTDRSGQLILKKVQIDDAPSVAHAGWICTYNVYDDKGLLRYQIQPEAVKYLDANNWSFAGDNGQKVLNDLCFQYNYDDKGRVIWKKTPGAAPINMLYDARNRLVFTQDGNQAKKSTPEWMATLYDDLDRPVITTLYQTSKTITDLKNDINNSGIVSNVSIVNSAQPIKDIVVANRDVTITKYAAQNSIEFTSEGNGGFESTTGDEFTAEIDPTAATGASTINTTTYNNPITSTDLNNPSVCTILKYLFYDNYSFDGVKSFDNNYTNLNAYNTTDPNVLPIAVSKRTISMPTGSKTRVLGKTTFLSSTAYYDEMGHLIQSLDENIKGGTDVNTFQYHFDGRVLSTYSLHSAPGTDYSSFTILTKYLFDKLGRITSLQKKFGENDWKTIAAYDFDDGGRVKTKHLDPGYTGNGGTELESLNYTFNIHNQLTGINKDYALKNPATYNKWSHFFGLYLGYDDKDQVFSKSELNGQVTGQLWNSQGDDAQRKYVYSYDNAGRLINASFTEQQHPGDGWSNIKMDFSASGSGGQITYDLNGNLITMLQKGVIPGTATPMIIDDLHYTYASYSNKLQSVIDLMPTVNSNGKSGDFKDGSNGSDIPDYVYDDNGNVVIDLNKNAQSLNEGAPGTNGISYNYLDKPEQIRIVGKGTIKFVYSADGEKLQRIYTPETGGASLTTTYINQFVYQSSTVAGSLDALSYINFEEGRIRVMQPTSQTNGIDALIENGNMTLPNGKMGAYDYFIMDHQKNVRMILTEETHTASNTCTMETARAFTEDAIFGQVGGSNEVETTRYPANSTGWANNSIGNSVSRLGNIAGRNIGPNTLQKVMAGDKVSATVQYYYNAQASGSNNGFVSSVISSIIQDIASGPTSSLVKGGTSGISNQLNLNNGFINAVRPATNTGFTPLSYLTVLFFDERFNFIGATDGGAIQQQVASSVGNNGSSLTIAGIKAPKNGYAYVYVSNQSDQDVYFDNLQVSMVAGNIIEENHYYPYGLKIAAISSKKLGDGNEGTLENKYQIQGAFSEMDEDIGWNDFALRNYDSQIGRWAQQDPYQQFASPYIGMGNDPTNTIDPTGGFSWPPPGLGVVSTITSSTTSTALQTTSQFFTIMNYVSLSIKAFQFGNALINTNTTTQGIGDNLLQESLESNPDFYGLSLGELRGMIKDFNKNLDQWQVNISAGILLEDLYEDFSGLTKNYSYNIIIGPNPHGVFPLVRKVVPDFYPGTEIVNDSVFPKGGATEVKAINDPITFSTSNYQVAGEASIVASATAYKEGLPDYTAENAGTRKAAAITFVLPADRSIDPGFIDHLGGMGVNVFVSYAFINIKTHRVVFSTPKKLNNISNLQPYPVQGTISGVAPNIERAANRWRIDEKKDIDDGDQ